MSEGLYKKSVDDSMDPHLPGKNSREEEKSRAKENAKNALRSGEDAAAGNESSGGLYAGGGGAAALGIEREGGGFYKGGNLANAAKAGFGKGKIKGGKAKKAGPIVAIALAIFGGGAAIGGLQSLMPFNLVEQFTEMNDGSFTSRSRRMPKLAKWIMNMQNDEDSVVKRRKRLFGDDYVKYRNGVKRNKKSLSNQGIEIVKEGKENVLKWKNRAGEEITITADDYGKMYRENTEFRNDFNRGTRGFTGRIAAWIDLSAARFLKRNSLTKNLFKDWSQKVIDAEGENTSFHDIITGRKPEASVEGGSSKKVEEVETDADGNQKTKVKTEEPDPVELGGGSKITKGKVKDMLSSAGSAAANIVCGVAAVSATVTAVKAVMAISNAMNYFQAAAEAADKVKAGDGEKSPIHELSADMTQTDKNGKTALEAEGMKMVLSGGSYKPNSSDPDTLGANIEDMFKSIGTSLGFVIGCQVAQIIAAGVSIGLTIATLGTFSIGKAIASIGIGVGIGVAVDLGVKLILSYMKNDYCLDAEGLARGTCMALGGITELKTNFRGGGGTIGTKEKVSKFYDAHKVALEWEAEYDRQTKSPFDINNGHTFLGSLLRKVALPVSQIGSFSGVINTFSSLVSSSATSLLPSAKAIDKTEYMNNQIGDCPSLETIGAVGDIYCNPMVITDMDTIDDDPEEDMNHIAEIGGFETESDGKVKLDEDGIEMIDADSNLGKYIRFCSERESPFGVVDMNISAAESETLVTVNTGNSTIDAAGNGAVGAIPIVGDIVDIVESGKTLGALPWSTGANCVARGGNEYASGEAVNERGENGKDTGQKLANSSWSFADTSKFHSISWDEMKYYQRYVEDDRIAESSGEKAASAVETFLARYEEEHPVDNSFEGVLARKTGYTKDQIAVTLNDMAYWDYIAKYDATDLYPLPVKKDDGKPNIELDSKKTDLPDIPETVLSTRVLYAPLRDRYSTVA